MNNENNNANIAIIAIAIIAIVSIAISKIIPSLAENNVKVGNLRAYVPRDWNSQGNYRVSPSGNCKTIGATTDYDQQTVEKRLIGEEFEHQPKIINDINISYGFKKNGQKEIYSYYFKDKKYNYFILFINNNNSDEDCNSYIEKLEKSIKLNK